MRKPRRIKRGSSYHVTARINRQEFIFFSKEVKEMFMLTVRRAKTNYDFIVRNFCIMNNHIHFIIEPRGDAELSKIMQWILGVFAQTYNRKYGLKGHVWYDRFKSKVIDSIRQYLNTFIYIANNPVKAGIVDRAADYEYNGIADMQKGIMDIMERPPNRIMKIVWKKINKF